MKKLRWFAITLFLLSVAVYALNQNQIRRKTDQTIPKISMDQDEIQVSVKDPEKYGKRESQLMMKKTAISRILW